LASAYGSSGLEVVARQARGEVLLGESEAAEAITMLRSACRLWQELDAKHSAAKTRVLLAQAYRALSDEDAAQLELDAACAVFERPGRFRCVARNPGGRQSAAGGAVDELAQDVGVPACLPVSSIMWVRAHRIDGARPVWSDG